MTTGPRLEAITPTSRAAASAGSRWGRWPWRSAVAGGSRLFTTNHPGDQTVAVLQRD